MLSIVGSMVGAIGSTAWVYAAVEAFIQGSIALGIISMCMIAIMLYLTYVNFIREL